MHIKTKLRATKEQLKLYQSWVKGLSPDNQKFVLHVFCCQLQYWLRRDNDRFRGVPVPRETFIHVFCRDYKWEEIKDKDIMWRSGYSIEDGLCIRYAWHEKLIEQFIEAGESHLLSISRVKEDVFYDIATGKKLPKLIKPFDPNMKSTPIDLGYGMGWLIREKNWIRENAALLTNEQLKKYERGYLHALRCYQSMLERLTSVNYKKMQAEYSQELVEPDEGLRKYEIGGGLQGCNKGLREALLCTSRVHNYDAVKCHATIAKVKMEEQGIDSGLQDILKDKVETPHRLLKPSTVKTAILAILNGAKLTNKLWRKTTIPQLITQDQSYKHLSKELKQDILNALVQRCESVHLAIKKWSKTIEKHKRIAKVSAYLQSVERDELTQLMSVACNNQHDGALVPFGEYVNPTTTILHITPKPIATRDTRFNDELRSTGPENEEDKRYVQEVRDNLIRFQHTTTTKENDPAATAPEAISPNKNTSYISSNVHEGQFLLVEC